MSFVVFGKTSVHPSFDSGSFKENFIVSNKYLNSYWFDCKDKIWDSISSQIAAIVESEVKKRMKTKMNKESYEIKFGI